MVRLDTHAHMLAFPKFLVSTCQTTLFRLVSILGERGSNGQF